MEQLRCTYCGGLLQDRGDHYVCESCRTKIKKSAMERLSDQDIFDLNAARRLKEGFRFDEAQAAYDEVFRRNPACEEAAWGAFLSEYGIEYQIEEQKPTFHALSDIPGRKSRYYGTLSSEHRAEVDQKIEPERLKIMRSVGFLPVYDVFLSLKINDEDGRRTPEHEWAMQLFHDLDKQGYRVFLSTQVLRTANFDWEPHIYRAIQTCRIMLVLTSSIENTNSPWVRNEWRRILSRIKNTPAGERAPVYRVIATDMYCVPAALSGKQVLLHGDYHLRELIEGAVKEACASPEDAKSEPPATAGHIQVPQSIRNIKHIPLLKELLRDAGFTNVREFPLHDMDGSDEYPWVEGDLASIMIAGEDYNFDGNTSYFDPATPVLITYHCLSEAAGVGRKERETAVRKTRDDTKHKTQAEAERNAREEAARKYEQEQAELRKLFEYDENGYVTLKDKETVGRVCIPDDAKGIAFAGFRDCNKITEVIIPNSVTEIGENAFLDCTGLTNITIPSSVARIGEWAFSGCTGLTSITIPNSVVRIGEWAFDDCTGLKSVTILGGVADIDEWAFSGCTGLTSITIPDSVIRIGERAFSGCTGLTSITIPNSVREMGTNPFGWCPDLRISLAQGNRHFRTLGNCLISEDGTLISGFNNSVIPMDGSVTKIEMGAFEGCTGLTCITIPDSVTKISLGVFEGCTGLTSIRYTGTKRSWKRLNKDTYWNEGSAITTIHCTNGDIKL